MANSNKKSGSGWESNISKKTGHMVVGRVWKRDFFLCNNKQTLSMVVIWLNSKFIFANVCCNSFSQIFPAWRQKISSETDIMAGRGRKSKSSRIQDYRKFWCGWVENGPNRQIMNWLRRTFERHPRANQNIFCEFCIELVCISNRRGYV